MDPVRMQWRVVSQIVPSIEQMNDTHTHTHTHTRSQLCNLCECVGVPGLLSDSMPTDLMA